MRRAVKIALIAFSIAAAALALLAAYALSPVGRNGLASIAERRIAQTVGGDVIIGSQSGDLTRRIELNDVRFVDNSANWATVKQIAIDWSPRALLSRRIEIGKVAIEDAVLLARPPARDRKAPFKGFQFPERLPPVSIDEIELRNMQVGGALVRDPLRLDGIGVIEMGGPALSISARLNEVGQRDKVEIDIRRTKSEAAPTLRIKISSQPNGAIAALTGSRGALAASVEGSGPPSAYRVSIEAMAGDVGALSGNLTSNIEELESIEFDLTATPGAFFDRWRTDLGDRIVASGSLIPASRGAQLKLRDLSAAFGGISGAAEWRNDRQALAFADATLTAKFLPEWRAGLQEAIGDRAEARITFERQGRNYAGTASIVAPAATAALEALTTDLRSKLSGDFSASIRGDSSIAAQIKSPLSGSGDLAFVASDRISLSDLELSTGNGAAFKGDALFQIDDRQFSIDGDIAATAAALIAYAPALTPRGGASGDIVANGSLTDFDLRLSLAAPSFQLNDSTWPASALSVSLSALPSTPTGEVSLRSTDGSLRSSARVRREPDGALSISGLDHRGDGFVLTGDATVNRASREGSIDLRYSGADGAEPWPGLVISGEASAKGSLANAGDGNQIEIKASSLDMTSVSLRNASLVARGPADQLSFEVGVSGISAFDQRRAENLRITGVAAIREKTALSIASASAEFQGAPVRLNRPAQITIGDGVMVEGLSMRVGESGTIDLGGAISPHRWRAEAAVRRLEISANGSTLDFDLALDTGQATAASGVFAASSGRLGLRDATLSGRYAWDGRRLSVAAGGGDSALDLDLDLPLTLRRAKRLSVSMTGAVQGNARYNGRAETIALFLPLALQSLEGDLDFSGVLGGTVRDPRISGDLALTDGAYTEAISGLSITDIDLTSSAAATTTSSSVTFKGSASGAGQSAKTILATGKIDLKGGVTLSADIMLDGARFAAGPVERVDASGALKIEGDADDLLVSGDVSIGLLEAKLFTPATIGLVDVDVVAIGDDGRPAAEEIAVRRRGALRYAVRIEADNNVLVSGRGLDSEWRANAQIAGNSERPLILGTMNLNRGDLEFSGRRFDLTRGSIGFDTLAPNDPSIGLRAERETRDGTTVAVVISGRSSALKVSLESTPSRPSEDVMALILFDKPADELSAFESLQVADSLTQLGGVGVFGGKGVSGAARDALGLDLLNLDVDQSDSSASLLTVGKYVTDGLFVSASQNARGENGSLRIEYEIGQSFTVETELRQDGDQTVSANWKKDF